MNRSALDHPANAGLRRRGEARHQRSSTPALASPDQVERPYPTTGIVFGYAGGTQTYALRLPERERAEAIRAGATRIKHYPGVQRSFDLDDFGPEWVFCGWLRGEEAWCRSAFECAGAG